MIGRLRAWRGALAETPHPEVVAVMLDESGYTEMWQKDRSPQAPGRLENLKELVGALSEYEDLASFLDHVSLVMDLEGADAGEMVNIMTLHGAKGLEFDTVFLPGWEEGLFPHQLALAEAGAAGLEEERRLAYVGLTRARRRAHILFAANRFKHGQWVSAIPSRFVDELAPDNVTHSERTGAQAAPGGLYRGHGSQGGRAPRGTGCRSMEYGAGRRWRPRSRRRRCRSAARRGRRATRPATASFTRSSATGRFARWTAKSSTSPSTRPAPRRSSTASFSPPTPSERPSAHRRARCYGGADRTPPWTARR